jgi:peptide/nickel transport system substrate-binding protein
LVIRHSPPQRNVETSVGRLDDASGNLLFAVTMSRRAQMGDGGHHTDPSAGGPMRLPRIPLAVAGTICLITTAACSSSGGGSTQKLANDATFVAPLASDPGNLNPLTAVHDTAVQVDSYAYDGLVNLDAAGKVVSGLASKWTVTSTKAVFTLQPGITCSDGAQLTATDVAATIKWVLNPKNGSYFLGSAVPADLSVTADDAARTVTLTVPQPYGFLLEGPGSIPIVCAKGLANPKSLAQHTDGTGPYVLSSYAADNQITLTARKEYTWGPGGQAANVDGFPAKVTLKVVQNFTTQVNLFLSGQLNEVVPNAPDVARVAGHNYPMLAQPAGPTDLFFNERASYVGADPAVRKALTMAIDRDAVAKVLTQGRGKPATTLTVMPPHPCGLPDNTKGALPSTHLQAAESALDQDGWAVGPDGIRVKDGKKLTVRFAYTTGQGQDGGVELLSQQWKKLGVDVQLKGQSDNPFLKTLFSGANWEAGIVDLKVVYPNTLVPFLSGKTSEAGGNNFAAINNADYQRLTTRAGATPGDQGGCQLWGQAEQALFTSADVVPLQVSNVQTFLRGAKFVDGNITPTSVRMLAST